MSNALVPGSSANCSDGFGFSRRAGSFSTVGMFRTGSVLLGPCFVHPSIKTYVAYAVKIAPMHFKGQELLLKTLH